MTVLKPVISEHSFKEASRGRFSFVVTKGATRPEIKRAIEKIFGVTVTGITVTATPAKSYRAGRSRTERTGSRGKKAVVTLKKDQKIDLFEVGADAK